MIRAALLALAMLFSVALGEERVEKDKVVVPPEVKVEPGSSRAFALALAAVPFEAEGFQHDSLVGAKPSVENVSALRTLFAKEYVVTNRVDLIEFLDKLTANGRQAQFTQMLKKVRELRLTADQVDLLPDDLREELGPLVKHLARMTREKNGILAYDGVRYIRFCRFGYGAGYLTEEETWRRIDTMAKTLQKAYPSFEAVGEIYAIGVDMFDRQNSAKTWDAWKRLKSDAKGPWKSVAWTRKLEALDKPEAPKPAEPASPPKK